MYYLNNGQNKRVRFFNFDVCCLSPIVIWLFPFFYNYENEERKYYYAL